MPSSKRRKRNPLFSLEARIARRARLAEDMFIEEDEGHFDDDCPACIAARSGQLTADMLTNPDPAFLSAAALRKLEAITLGPGESLELMATGSYAPDGRITRSRWTVDASGDIHRERDGERVFVCNARLSQS